MKKILSIILLFMVSIALIGCGATPLTENQKELQVSKNDAQGKCFDRLAAQDTKLAMLLAKVPDEQIALVIVLQGMQENNKALMAIATGNQYNPCANGTSAFDVQIAEVIAKNKSVQSGISGTLGISKWLVGGYTIGKVVDKVSGDTLNAYAGSEANVGSKNTTSVATGYNANSYPGSDNQAPNAEDNHGATLAQDEVEEDLEEEVEEEVEEEEVEEEVEEDE